MDVSAVSIHFLHQPFTFICRHSRHLRHLSAPERALPSLPLHHSSFMSQEAVFPPFLFCVLVSTYRFHGVFVEIPAPLSYQLLKERFFTSFNVCSIHQIINSSIFTSLVVSVILYGPQRGCLHAPVRV